MKKTPLLLSCIFILFISCSDPGDTIIKDKLKGKWKLVETLTDPGNGSGTFQPVESEKIIEFKNAGMVTVSNGSFCFASSQSDVGTYSIKRLTINPKNCDSTIRFELSDDSTLILSFPCIEPCGEKYIKIE